MEKNIVMETSKNALNELARRDGLEGWPKVAAHLGLALLELAKLVTEAEAAKKQKL